MLSSLATAKHKILNSNARWQFILLGVILALVVLYVAQTNNQASQSFSIRRLEIKREELSEQIRQLSWEVSRARTITTIEERARALSLAVPSDISFVKASLEAVAVAK